MSSSMLHMAYEECAFTYGLPLRNNRAAPIEELTTKDRNTLLACALQSGSYNFVHWAMQGSKEMLSIESKLDGQWPVASVAGWANGKAAVDTLELVLESNGAIWKINSSAPLMAALYEAATVDAASYLAKKYDYLLKEENRQLLWGNDYPKYVGLTLAQYHTYKGRADVAEYFVGKGSKVATPGMHFRHWLLEKEKSKLLDDKLDAFLVAHGVPRDERDEKGQTVLHAAVAQNDEKLASYLVEHGADANAADATGESPLFDAARNNRRALAQILLARAANPNSRNHKGQTPLHAAFSAAAWEVGDALLGKGARLDLRDTLGRTAAFDCVSRGCPPLDRLAATGIDFNVRDNAGNSLLHEAATFVSDGGEMARNLIARGASVDLKNIDGKTALHLAASQNNAPLSRLLLEKGAPVNDRDNLGNTPLHLTASPEVVTALLDSGANPDLPNKRGDRPVNGTVERTQMLFHSPAQIHAKSDTLPRYFTGIRVGGDIKRAELVTPTQAVVGEAIAGPDNSFNTEEVAFMPRGAALEFRVQQACEAGANLQTGDDVMALPHLAVSAVWQDLNPVDGQPQAFRAAIKADQCELPAITPEDILNRIKRDQPASVEKWRLAARSCIPGQNDGRCNIFVRPVLRVLVKNGAKWKEAGILRTSESEQ
ncbi:MAG TPA: ankyrin repeat domain-containing protein [Gallionella sp.]|nr:ankyrin repeat domain-containing protein [Gallionella sp.]